MDRALLSITIFLSISWINLLIAGTIVGSKHDLSATNYYGAAGGTVEVCVFCHTPHGANDSEVNGGPLWNRNISDINTFEMYGGAGTPNYFSLVCLSCHDGVSSQGVSAINPGDTHSVINPDNLGGGDPNCGACHPFARGGGGIYPATTWQIGPILTNDHPVSIDYSDAVASNPAGEFKATPDAGIKLFDDKVECASCHNVHDPDNGLFLRVDNTQSALCRSCHSK